MHQTISLTILYVLLALVSCTTTWVNKRQEKKIEVLSCQIQVLAAQVNRLLPPKMCYRINSELITIVYEPTA